MASWTGDVLHFWFDDLGPNKWFGSDQETDSEIRRRFEPLWQSMRGENAALFVNNPSQALAAVILFDQFPRNIFRHKSEAFATDPMSLEIAKLAIAVGYNRQLTADEQHFLYMPFMHSENLVDQEKSVELFDALGNGNALKFAIMHRDLIRRFGRFPHRNKVLNRETLPHELDAIAEGEKW
jgi:uncharacterized protein (DUF924 family)